MILALWNFDREELLASLLLFRLLYYVIPFALALAILGAREILKGMFSNRVPKLGDIAADVIAEPVREPSDKKPSNVDGSRQ
jgi:hypothetical protein